MLFLLLPLYELIDIGEQWPFDGDVVSVILCCLLIVAALLACRTWRRVWLALTRLARCRVAFARTPVSSVHAASIIEDGSSLFLVICSFLI